MQPQLQIGRDLKRSDLACTLSSCSILGLMGRQW